MMNCQKHLFQLSNDVHYLNCAYKAPMLKSAEEAVIEALIKERNPASITQDDFFKDVPTTKELFAELTNCDKSQVATISSVSYGMASVLKNIQAPNGMKAVTVAEEFPSGYLTLSKWCEKNEAKLEVISPDKDQPTWGESWNQNLLDAIDENTAIVLISSVHWTSGLKFDLEKIGVKCQQVGAKFVVDGTQSVGATPMDVKKFKITALVCAGYKWLLGPYSLGLMYISDEFNEGKPLEESWMNRSNAQDMGNITNYSHDYTIGAGRYNLGETSNFLLMPYLTAGLKQLKEWTIPAMQEYNSGLSNKLIKTVEELGIVVENDAYRSDHLLSLRLPKGANAEQIKNQLVQDKIYTSVRSGAIRVAVNVFNTEEDIEKLTSSLKTSFFSYGKVN